MYLKLIYSENFSCKKAHLFAEDYRMHPKIAEGADERTELVFYYINSGSVPLKGTQRSKLF